MEAFSKLSKNELIEKANEQAQLIQELNTQLDSQSKKPATKYPTVKHGNDTYKVLAKSFSFEGKIVTAEDLESDKNLVDQLVAIESGFLKKIEK